MTVRVHLPRSSITVVAVRTTADYHVNNNRSRDPACASHTLCRGCGLRTTSPQSISEAEQRGRLLSAESLDHNLEQQQNPGLGERAVLLLFRGEMSQWLF